ncbi:tetratricopeptide repeat protein [Sphingorhabdus sp. Alg239-R122]|uniref:tetratricopeptide repeat protein n=1 Tax=Sphingorhabdus sp. Alg239-R122 TaxID=2305989 RepID=UPI0013DA5A8B|nr:tetratricopeptide repeat protein [Sphingorhabdus sp. Alg239-R122]
MRYSPAALALSLAFAVTSSATYSQQSEREVDPKSVTLVEAGEAAQNAGDLMAAADLYESALAIDPGNRNAFIALAKIAQEQKLPGKAIRLYREALEINPNDRVALAGQGQAMVQRGAVEKARENLARLESICRTDCAEVAQLSATIDQGPPSKVLSAEAVTPEPVIGEASETP